MKLLLLCPRGGSLVGRATDLNRARGGRGTGQGGRASRCAVVSFIFLLRCLVHIARRFARQLGNLCAWSDHFTCACVLSLFFAECCLVLLFIAPVRRPALFATAAKRHRGLVALYRSDYPFDTSADLHSFS